MGSKNTTKQSRGVTATLFKRGLFSLLHCGAVAAVCVTKCESSETETVELVERDDTEELIHNIHTDRHKYNIINKTTNAVQSRAASDSLFSLIVRLTLMRQTAYIF